MTQDELRQMIVGASAPGVLALQGVLQLGVALNRAGIDPVLLEDAAAVMNGHLRAFEAALPARWTADFPAVRDLLDRWSAGNPPAS